MVDNLEPLNLPDDACSVHLSQELLDAERARWCELVQGFDPFDRPEGWEMTEWLRECVQQGHLPLRTHLVYNEHLLGFFAMDPHQYLEVVGDGGAGGGVSMARSVLISNIVRSARTPKGFGRVLIEEAVGVALEELDSAEDPVRGLLVDPANRKLSRMWKTKHHFEALSDGQRLFFPLDAAGREES